MHRVIVVLMVSVGLWAVMPNSAIAGCNPDPCPEGQTCRYEQPNTFFCKAYNNVSGSQGGFEQQGSSRSGDPKFSAPNREMPTGQAAGMRGYVGAQKASDCAGNNVACVDIVLNNTPYSVPSVLAAVELVLQKQLEGQRIFSLNFQPNEASARLLRGQRIEVENALNGLLNHRFVEQPDLPAIMNIRDLMPPPDFLYRIDPMTGSELARLNQMYGYDAMQAAIQEIQRLAQASGGNFLQFLFAAEVVSATTTVVNVVTAAATAYLLYDKLTEEEDEKSGGDTVINVASGATVHYYEGDEIIAEKDRHMLVNTYHNLRNSVQNMASMRGMF